MTKKDVNVRDGGTPIPVPLQEYARTGDASWRKTVNPRHIHVHPHPGVKDLKVNIHQVVIDNLSGAWQDMERKFLGNLRSELKAQHRRTHRTASATRTMSKRKRAGSRRWPVSSSHAKHHATR